ncbi:hypothetical protein ACP275_10G082900 [Erythranthe tilingii]
MSSGKEYSVMEREYWKPDDAADASPPAAACPRCGSSNTKFCYYNNYSLTQPRFFCKGCRRYWTKGGSLRNVPVGGGCRKTRRRGQRTVTNPAENIQSTTNSILSGGAPPHGDSTSIDLAAVYANFLNHHHHHQQTPPPPRQLPEIVINDHLIPQLPPEGILNINPASIMEFSGFDQGLNQHGFFECGSPYITDHTRLILSESSASVPPPLLGCGSSMFFDGSFQKLADAEGINSSFFINGGSCLNSILPPLPGEDVAAAAATSDASERMLWPDSDVVLPPSMHETTGDQQAVEPGCGNLSPFSDGLNLEAFFRS